MSSRNLIVSVVFGIVLLFAVAGEGYFIFSSQKENDSADAVVRSMQDSLKPHTASTTIAQAQENLQAQTEKLDEMQAGFPDSASLDADIQTAVKKTASEMAKDDALISDPDLKFSSQITIVGACKKADAALASVRTLEAKDTVSTPALNDAAENAVALVETCTNDISAYIDSLSAGGSGLAAGDASGYQAQIGQISTGVDSAKDSLDQIDAIPADRAAGADSTSTASTTLGDVLNQQNVVNQASDQLNQLLGQDGSIGNSNSSGLNGSNDDDGSNSDYGSDSGQSQLQNQSQSAPIKLIEGENTF